VARLSAALALGIACATLGCGKLRRECDAVVKTANAFIAESARHRPSPDAPPEQAAREALETAARYDQLANDLAAIRVESDELRPEVQRYADLAVRSAASLRAAAQALRTRHFEQARQKRVELDAAAKTEGPLVARINALCRE
jgi:hypothetical protein